MKHITVFLSKPNSVLSSHKNIPKLHSVNNRLTYCSKSFFTYTITPNIADQHWNVLMPAEISSGVKEIYSQTYLISIRPHGSNLFSLAFSTLSTAFADVV